MSNSFPVVLGREVKEINLEILDLEFASFFFVKVGHLRVLMVKFDLGITSSHLEDL